MFKKGHYLMKIVYIEGREQWLVSNTSRTKDYHTHIPYNLTRAAKAIVHCASEGKIPLDYPEWMIESINRLWFGKDYKDRLDICNDNLYTNDPAIRLPNRKKEKRNSYNNGYKNRPKVLRA